MESQYHAVVGHGKPQVWSKSRDKREVRSVPPLAWDIGAEKNRGTNIQHISLDRTHKKHVPQGRIPPDGLLPQELNMQGSEFNLVMAVGGVMLGLFSLCLTAIPVLLCKKKKNSGKKAAPEGSGSSEPMMQSQHSDSSEV